MSGNGETIRGPPGTAQPTRGSEIRNTRPCLVISLDEMHHARTVIIAPMTTTAKEYPTRIPVSFEGKHGYVVLDQIRTVDQVRLVRRLGTIDSETGYRVLDVLRQMFEP